MEMGMWWGLVFSARLVRAFFKQMVQMSEVGPCLVGSEKSQEARGAGGKVGGKWGDMRSDR